MRLRGFTVGFLGAFAVFVTANVLAVHLRSDGGLLEGLGLVHHWNDGIRRIGFPFQVFEDGGYVYRREFSPLALLLDVLIMAACALLAGFIGVRVRGKVHV